MLFSRLRLSWTVFIVGAGCASTGSGSPSSGVDAGNGSSSGSGGAASSSSGGSGSGGSSSGGSSGSSGAAGSSSGSSSGGASSGGGGDGGASSGTADGGGDAAAASGCNGLPLCDDFDAVTDVVGSPPSSGLWTLIGTAGCSGSGNPMAPTVYPIVVDTTYVHSPPKSVKVVGGDSCGPLMIHTAALAKITGGEVYGRFWVRLSDTTLLVHHAVLMALGFLHDAGTGLNITDYNSYLELAPEAQGGLSTTTLSYQTTDSDHLPNTDSVGAMSSTYLPSGAFACLEFHASANTNAIETWINGALIAGLTSPPAPPSANGQSMWAPPSPFAPASFGLGWMSFNTQGMTVWFDDVALAGTRIGCQ